MRYSIEIPRQNYYDTEHNKRVGIGRVWFESDRFPTPQDVVTLCQCYLIGANQVPQRRHNYPAMMDTIATNPGKWPAVISTVNETSTADVTVCGEQHQIVITIIPEIDTIDDVALEDTPSATSSLLRW